MIITRYWTSDKRVEPGAEHIEWHESTMPNLGFNITIPDLAEVEGDPITGNVQWVSIVQAAFDYDPRNPERDVYKWPLADGVRILTKDEWDELWAEAHERDDQALQERAQADADRMAKREAVLMKLAEASGLSEDEIHILLGD